MITKLNGYSLPIGNFFCSQNLSMRHPLRYFTLESSMVGKKLSIIFPHVSLET